ncbi:MAG: glycoside hydrolase family 97 catalytic domain-containing protein [Bacteroidales bacterium]|nr:glycoside hydrolase family 97 catalytic domain-containing protein [Bacteroidales bacterium]
MKIRTLIALSLLIVGAVACKKGLSSPDGSLSLNVDSQTLAVSYKGAEVFSEIHLGLIAENANYDDGLKLKSVSGAKKVSESYDMLTGKRSHCSNEANEVTLSYKTPKGDKFKVLVRLYNDGLAFRYILPEGTKIVEEKTSYIIKDGVNRWIAPQVIDWENNYPLTTNGKRVDTMRGPEQDKDGKWAFPALLEPSKGVFALITEAELRYQNSGSYLDNNAAEDHYTVNGFSDSVLPDGLSPWRLAIIGGIETIAESTLVTDVCTPNQIADPSWIKPGVSSWIYWGYNGGSRDYNLLVEYVDLAAEMGWPYSLADGGWPGMRGGTIEELVAYAKEKGVKMNVWYNSETSIPTRLKTISDPEGREKEFQRLEDLGITGVKIDFFLPDSASMVNYYLDLLKDAAKHHLLVDFHGCTMPNGWQRTWPNLMTMEGVFGSEQYNNGPFLSPGAAAHNATLPFTRNAIGPMDYTPGTFSDSRFAHITTNAHELALPVLFESGLQHMPDIPSSYYELADEIKATLKTLPSVWDETVLLDGYPGVKAVLARRSGSKWYIAGVNGLDTPATLQFSLDRLGDTGSKSILFCDGDEDREIKIAAFPQGKTVSVPCRARGGFLAVIE